MLAFREMEFAQRDDAEKKRLEEVEKTNLAEIQSLQVRVITYTHTHTHTHTHTSVHFMATVLYCEIIQVCLLKSVFEPAWKRYIATEQAS